MSGKRREGVHGLTRYTTTTWSDPLSESDVKELRTLLSGQTLIDRLGEMEAVGQAVLRKSGLPSDARGIESDDGSRITSISELTKDRPHTPEWFAAKILNLVHVLRQNLASNTRKKSKRSAVQAALNLQKYYDLAFFKFSWEEDVLAHQRDVAQRKRNLKKWTETQKQEAEAFWEPWKKVYAAERANGLGKEKARVVIHAMMKECRQKRSSRQIAKYLK